MGTTDDLYLPAAIPETTQRLPLFSCRASVSPATNAHENRRSDQFCRGSGKGRRDRQDPGRPISAGPSRPERRPCRAWGVRSLAARGDLVRRGQANGSPDAAGERRPEAVRRTALTQSEVEQKVRLTLQEVLAAEDTPLDAGRLNASRAGDRRRHSGVRAAGALSLWMSRRSWSADRIGSTSSGRDAYTPRRVDSPMRAICGAPSTRSSVASVASVAACSSPCVFEIVSEGHTRRHRRQHLDGWARQHQ